MTDIGDRELARSTANGNESAFEKVYLKYKKRVSRVCLSIAKDNSIVEDLAQETFLVVFRKIRQFRGDSDLYTWIYRIAVNTALQHLRRERSRLTVEAKIRIEELPRAPFNYRTGVAVQRIENQILFGGQETDLSIPGQIDKKLAQVPEDVSLENIMRSMPRGYREVFFLHDIEGYEHQEIAAIVGCSIGNSKSQLFKARHYLRKRLAPT